MIEIPRARLAARNITTLISGGPIFPTGRLYAALTVLPIGWSWSFFIVRALHEELIAEVGFKTERCQSSVWQTPALDEGPVDQPYCDNLQVLGYDPVEVDDMLERIMTHSRSKGFLSCTKRPKPAPGRNP